MGKRVKVDLSDHPALCEAFERLPVEELAVRALCDGMWWVQTRLDWKSLGPDFETCLRRQRKDLLRNAGYVLAGDEISN